MAGLVWDKIDDRVYETGLDHGVLYLPDGSAVPWNGLTSIVEKPDKEVTSVYYDGININNLVSIGSFLASMKAVTYPDEFLELEGLASSRQGMWLGEQPPKVFGLCYRTLIGDAIEGDSAGYKINILYNVTAVPKDKTYATLSDSTSLTEFEWDIYAVPEELPGFRPTAHFIIDSREFDPILLQEIEDILYGGSSSSASLIPMPELISYINGWARIKIVDNLDGTWSAISDIEGLIEFLAEGSFQINKANAVYLDADTYEISDTVDMSDVPNLQIDDHGDGSFTITTEHEDLIVMIDEGTAEIRNPNVLYIDEESYTLSSTTDV